MHESDPFANFVKLRTGLLKIKFSLFDPEPLNVLNKRFTHNLLEQAASILLIQVDVSRHCFQ